MSMKSSMVISERMITSQLTSLNSRSIARSVSLVTCVSLTVVLMYMPPFDFRVILTSGAVLLTRTPTS